MAIAVMALRASPRGRAAPWQRPARRASPTCTAPARPSTAGMPDSFPRKTAPEAAPPRITLPRQRQRPPAAVDRAARPGCRQRPEDRSQAERAHDRGVGPAHVGLPGWHQPDKAVKQRRPDQRLAAHHRQDGAVGDQNHCPGSISPRSRSCCEFHWNFSDWCHRNPSISWREPGLLRSALATRKEQIAAVIELCHGQA